MLFYSDNMIVGMWVELRAKHSKERVKNDNCGSNDHWKGHFYLFLGLWKCCCGCGLGPLIGIIKKAFEIVGKERLGLRVRVKFS